MLGKYPSATQLSFEQKEKVHLPPSFGTATRGMPTYVGKHTMIKTSDEIERKRKKRSLKHVSNNMVYRIPAASTHRLFLEYFYHQGFQLSCIS